MTEHQKSLLQFSTLALIVLSLGSAGAFLWLMFVGYTPTPIADQWGVLYTLALQHGLPSMTWFWNQSNEHRILLYKIALLADLRFFGGQSYLTLTLIYLAFVLHWASWGFFIRQSADLPRWLYLLLTGLFGAFLMSPSQDQNYSWSFQLTFVMCFSFASLAFQLAVLNFSRKKYLPGVLYSGLSAFAAELCLASGLVVWPVLWLIALQFRIPKKFLLSYVAAGCLAIVVYFQGYKKPAAHADPLQSLRQIGRVIRYMTVYFSHPIETYTTYSGFVAIVLAFLSLYALYQLNRSPQLKQLARGLSASMLFLFGTGFLTALGRLNFGSQQAGAGRYQTPVLVFWACSASAILLCLYLFGWWRELCTLSLVIVTIVLLPIQDLAAIRSRLDAQRSRYSFAGEALEFRVNDQLTEEATFATVVASRPATAYLNQTGVHVAPRPTAVSDLLLQPDRVAPGLCQGRLETVSPQQLLSPGVVTYRADGWAVDSKHKSPVPLIVLTDADGKFVTSTGLHFAAGSAPMPPGLTADTLAVWRVYFRAPASLKAVKAFAILGDRTCPLEGTRAITAGL